MEYLWCNFSGKEHVREPQVTIGEDVVVTLTNLKHLGSIIQSNRRQMQM